MTTKPKVRKFRIRRSTPLSLSAEMGTKAPTSNAATTPAAQAGANDTGGPSRLSTSPPPRPREVLPKDAAAAPATPADTARPADTAAAPNPPAEVDGPALAEAETDLDAIRKEGLTGRQLRMARRVAMKHGIAAASDFDAVRQLRSRGIDPFQRSNILELVVPDGQAAADGSDRVQLPQTVPQKPANLPSTERTAPDPARAAAARSAEIAKIQKDLAKRRRRRFVLLMTRLAVFVLLPTMVAGYYFFQMATPMYATKSEFVIQQAESGAGAGLGGLFQGTSMATQQDSITVQSYLTSRAAMIRLDEEEGFKAVFADPAIDPIQRLEDGATNEAAYGVYQDHVRISYDPTEGIVKLEVIAPDPQVSQRFSEALIAYAEEQVDQLTRRLREDGMAGARESYEAAEARRAEALAAWLAIQEQLQQIDPVGETAARTSQISALETERQQLMLELQTRLAVRRPNEAQVNALQTQIAGIENLIADMRAEMTGAAQGEASLAAKNTELRLAEENYTFQTLMVQQALQQMEAAQIEANRQVRYLSLGVEPVAPDEASYPRSFENTVLAFLIFAGIYLMLSLTASILREQVTS